MPTDAVNIWPLTGLRLVTQSLELRFPSNEDLLSLASIDSGLELRFEPVDLAALLSAQAEQLRLLAPGFASLPTEFINRLSTDETVEIRAQAAWLLGIRGQRETARELAAADRCHDRSVYSSSMTGTEWGRRFLGTCKNTTSAGRRKRLPHQNKPASSCN